MIEYNLKTITHSEINDVINFLVPAWIDEETFNKLLKYADTWNCIHQNIYKILNDKKLSRGGNNNTWLLYVLKGIVSKNEDSETIRQEINEVINKHLYSNFVYFNFLVWTENRDKVAKYLYETFGLKLEDNYAFRFMIERDKLDNLYTLSYIMEK